MNIKNPKEQEQLEPSSGLMGNSYVDQTGTSACCPQRSSKQRLELKLVNLPLIFLYYPRSPGLGAEEHKRLFSKKPGRWEEEWGLYMLLSQDWYLNSSLKLFCKIKSLKKIYNGNTDHLYCNGNSSFIIVKNVRELKFLEAKVRSFTSLSKIHGYESHKTITQLL